jgi:hypothetical protein
MPPNEFKEATMRGRRIGGLGVRQGLVRGLGVPVSPMLHSLVDLRAEYSNQVAEEPLVPPPDGVQRSDALRRSDTLPELFGIA